MQFDDLKVFRSQTALVVNLLRRLDIHIVADDVAG